MLAVYHLIYTYTHTHFSYKLCICAPLFDVVSTCHCMTVCMRSGVILFKFLKPFTETHHERRISLPLCSG